MKKRKTILEAPEPEPEGTLPADESELIEETAAEIIPPEPEPTKPEVPDDFGPGMRPGKMPLPGKGVVRSIRS